MANKRRDEPVVLSAIYTRTGDEGTTALVDGSRVAKTDSRLAAYADTDEANCAIGMAVTFGQLPASIPAPLPTVQYAAGAAGRVPATPHPRKPPRATGLG